MSWLSRLLGGEDDAAPRGDPERVAAVQRLIDEIAPLVAADGGEIRLVEVADDGRVRVRLRGACAHCHASPVTLQGALEPRLRAELDWFRELRAD